MELTLGENSEVTDEVLVAIAKDCIKYKWKQEPEHSFTAAENRRYRAIEAASTGHGFWGGYSFLDEVAYKSDASGFIRLYSPQGSGKWCFCVKDNLLEIWCA